MKDAETNPIYLLADSRLLFQKKDGDSHLMGQVSRLMQKETGHSHVAAAYIGASNGDLPEFFEIFHAAFGQISTPHVQCRMIPSQPSVEELRFLSRADLILLSGGETTRGWEIISNTFHRIIENRYKEGAIIMGISAGAIQLGLKGFSTAAKAFETHMLFDTLGLAPFLVDVHDEDKDWQRLEQLTKVSGLDVLHIGIPFGGAVVFHPDGLWEAIEQPVVSYHRHGADVRKEIHTPGVRLQTRKNNAKSNITEII